MKNPEKQGSCPVGVRQLSLEQFNRPHGNPLLVSLAKSSEPGAEPVIDKPAESGGL